MCSIGDGELSVAVRRRITIHGIVQGVGFRPTVHRLARRHALSGHVHNFTGGVVIELEGEAEALEAFGRELEVAKPPIAIIDEIRIEDLSPTGERGFVIAASERSDSGPILICPDVAICAECERELYDPTDRRHGHPFINCTNCGPRFTIIRAMPYDRPSTSMARFGLCDACRAEYEDIADRRYHAQPVACPQCGPTLCFVDAEGRSAPDPLAATRRMLAEGKIVAVKGLGGFHLACDATNDEAVRRLRLRKHREQKPLAIMSDRLQTIEEYAEVPEWALPLLTGAQRPIVLLPKRPAPPSPYPLPEGEGRVRGRGSPALQDGAHTAIGRRAPAVAPSVAPDSASFGVMLPYTPLHHLLFHPAEGDGQECPSYAPSVGRGSHPAPEVAGGEDEPDKSVALTVPNKNVGPTVRTLVMTSGNLSDEPLATDNDEARARLGDIADGFLLHDRDIYIGCDDSVVRPTPVGNIVMRRARGFAPFPVRLLRRQPPVLALGAHLKNTFCLTSGNYAYLSQHLGDLEDAATLSYLQRSLAHFETLLEVHPEVLACDLHPDYLSSQYAQQFAAERGLPLVRVQHHHAHIASCLAERRLDQRVVGIACDGIGYGDDGCIWGCEILVADLCTYSRQAHLPYLPLPGGEQAIREPWRMAAVYLREAFGPTFPEQLDIEFCRAPQMSWWPLLQKMIAAGVNCPRASSAGRLFDAVAALLGLPHTAAYEAQAAMRLEMIANQAPGNGPGAPLGRTYPYDLRPQTSDRTSARRSRQRPRPAASRTGDHAPEQCGHLLMDPLPMIPAIVEDLRAGRSASDIAATFHDTVVLMLADAARRVAAAEGLTEVVLSGGTFQNEWILRKLTAELEARRLTVHTHDQVPCNDGGLCLGQALVALRQT